MALKGFFVRQENNSKEAITIMEGKTSSLEEKSQKSEVQ